MNPLHVVQLGPIPPPHGGIASNMLAIRDEVRSRGHRCSLVATSKSTAETTEAGYYYPASPLELVKTVRSLAPDVIHLHVGGEVSLRVAALAAFATSAAKRSVFTLHSGGYPRSRAGRKARALSFRGLVFRRFSRVIAVNDELKETFRRYGIPANRTLSISPFAPSDPDVSITLPTRFDDFFDAYSPSLLAVGGLEPDYNPLFLIAAMREMAAREPDAGLMIVGDGSMRPVVEQAIAASPAKTKIKLAGSVDHEVTLHLIDRADVMLRTTLFDGDAISVREALHLGTPVIATDNGMRPEGVHLIDQGDTSSLVDTVEKITTEKRPKVRQPIDRSNITSIADLYQELAAA